MPVEPEIVPYEKQPEGKGVPIMNEIMLKCAAAYREVAMLDRDRMTMAEQVYYFAAHGAHVAALGEHRRLARANAHTRARRR